MGRTSQKRAAGEAIADFRSKNGSKEMSGAGKPSALTREVFQILRSVTGSGPAYAPVSLLSEDTALTEVKYWTPTGFAWLDHVVSKGKGLPGGRIIEFFGGESSGKTSLAQKIVPQFQAQGSPFVKLDAEGDTDRDFLEKDGVDLSNTIVYPPPTIQQGFDVVSALFTRAKTGKRGKGRITEGLDGRRFYILWDSVSASSSMEIQDDTMADAQVAVVARAMAKGLRKVGNDIAESGSTLLFINHIKDKIGVVFGEKTTTPGGRHLRFAASVRLKFDRIGADDEKDSGESRFQKVRITARKTRFARIGRFCELILDLDKGFDPARSLLHWFKRTKLVRLVGRGLVLPLKKEVKLARKDWSKWAEDNPGKIEKLVRAASEVTVATRDDD